MRAEPVEVRLSALRQAQGAYRQAQGAYVSATDQPLSEVLHHLVLRHSLLGHRVPLPDGDGLVLESVEIDSDAVRRTDFILPAVATADGLSVVEVDVPRLAQPLGEIAGLGRESLVPGQRQHRHLYRRQPGIEPQHRTLVNS